MTQTGEYIRRTQGTGFKVMAGRDTMVLATLVYGGVGCVATTANIAPALVVKIYDRFQAGDLPGALKAQYELAPLRLAFNLGSWPVVTKDALNLLGFAAGAPILPNTSCSGPALEKLKQVLANLGLLR
jgi:4-hydroxy-tetrahydrodipicolinate synthase